MFNKKTLAIALLTTATCSSVFAATVNFAVGQRNGTFNCTASNPLTTISIDTHGVDINGGCAGRPFVRANGHLAGVPANIINSYYFQVNKSLSRTGSVEINPSVGTITCTSGHGEKIQSYGDGSYCLK